MKYLEIRDGFSVRIDAIEAVERVGELDCVVKTQFNTYDSTFPYLVMLQLLEREDMPEPTETEQKVLNILEEVGTPAH